MQHAPADGREQGRRVTQAAMDGRAIVEHSAGTEGSTEAYDRGEKLEQYVRLDSLQEVALIVQAVMRVENWRRAGGSWLLRDVAAPDGALHLTALDCSIPLREIYERVELAPER